MLYNFQRKKLCRHLLIGGALFAAGMGIFSCTDSYDLDDDQPSNLNNIYGYLRDQGNFQNTLRLINDLGQAEILSKTGSKTMFVANDDAFKTFYASNSWGVKSYEDLTLAQKKILLNSAMIDNPYSTSMLSTASGNDGPVKGEVCRRSSSLTLYDSVLVVASESQEADDVLPHNARFDQIRSGHDTIVLYTDASNAAPMIHFNYKFVASNKLSNTDIDFLYNQQDGTRHNDDVYVNNAKVVRPNIFSKNGFIHEVDRVIVPLDNMAEIIRKDKEVSKWSSIIERFAAPDYSKDLTDAYNLNKGTQYDSVYIKRYFSDRSAGSTRETDVAFSKDKDNNTFDASLKFDPGWNKYMPLSGDPRDAMMEDMAVMLVPTDEAFDDWWNNGGGSVIKNYYGTLENTPNSVLDDLIRVNQLASLVGSLPSRFEDVLNDANEPLGLVKDSVKSVTLGCNGVIYKTHKVYAPTSYSSVLFPAVIDTTNFKIIENAISCLDYDKYLNSMVSRYIFLIPTNKGLLSYVDPVSYGQTTSTLWEFGFDETKDKFKRIYADVYKCELNGTTGKWEKTGDRVTRVENMSINPNSNESKNVLRNRLEDLLDNIIIVEPYQDGKQYYKTKADTYVRIPGKPAKGLEVYGPFQAEREYPLNITADPYEMQNGYALVVDGPVMGARRSVADVIAGIIETTGDCSEFFNILMKCGAISQNNDKDKWAGSSLNLFNLKTYGDVGAEDKPAGNIKQKATYLLNNYQYTFYVPNDAAMQKAYDMGLPTISELEDAEAWDTYFNETLTKEEQNQLVKEQGCCAGDSAARIQEAMLDFVKYHIQTKSIYIDNGFESGKYESAKTSLASATDMAENVKPEDIDIAANKITIKGKQYDIKSLEALNDDGTRSVVYYTGMFSPGGAYLINVHNSASDMTVTDNIGNTHKVVMDEGCYNVQAQEYWYASTFDGTKGKIMTATDDPHKFYIANYSSVAVHVIDGPLVYADGNHKDSNGDIVPTQFKYTYKKLTGQ